MNGKEKREANRKQMRQFIDDTASKMKKLFDSEVAELEAGNKALLDLLKEAGTQEKLLEGLLLRTQGVLLEDGHEEGTDCDGCALYADIEAALKPESEVKGG